MSVLKTLILALLGVATFASAGKTSPRRQVTRALTGPASIQGLLATITNQGAITIPSNAISAFATLANGGTLSAAETTAVNDCADAARAFNTGSKADLGSTSGNIVFDANKIATHACEAAVGGETSTALTLLASNIGNINVQLSRLGSAALPALTVLST
ncbi:hypothetical protein RQP46_001914 [Phenoliferia psychrophenolica]